MAAELVETNRLWARRVATIEPEWAERIGAHLVRRSYGEPRWDARRGAAVTTETVTLYGLPIVEGRTVAVRPRRPGRSAGSCSSATRSSTATGSPTTRSSARNAAFLDRVAGHGGAGASGRAARRRGRATVLRRARRRRRHVGPPLRPVVEADAGAANPTCSTSPTPCSRATAAFRTADYPDHWRDGDLDAAAVVPLRPRRPARRRVGARAADGAQPVHAATGFDWQIPGHRAELVGALVRTLPKDDPPRADPGGRDDARPRWSGWARRTAGSSTRWRAALAEVSGVRGAGRRVRPAAPCRRTS